MNKEKSVRQRIREVNFEFYDFLLWRKVGRMIDDFSQTFDYLADSAKSTSDSMEKLTKTLETLNS